MRELILGARRINDDEPPLIIAEIGINHAGVLSEAFKLVDAAISGGAEVIKHQTHVIEDEMTAQAKQVIPGNSEKSIHEIMAGCALSEKEEIELKEYVESKGAIYLSTPFSRAAADRLERMGVCGYKIGSGECNNIPLLKHIASFKKPMIVSTGMNDLATVKLVNDVLKNAGVSYAFLHTTNLYPTPPHLVRLGAMEEMMHEFPDVQVGLSDHTITNHACFAAVAMGANILERHFTDTKSRVGPDIICSMTPEELSDLIAGAKIISEMRGGEKRAASEEKVTIDFAFATVVSISPIKKGEVLSEANIWVKRPGTGGIPASEFEGLLGKVAARDLPEDTHLCWEDVY